VACNHSQLAGYLAEHVLHNVGTILHPPVLVAPLRTFVRQQLSEARHVFAITDCPKLDYQQHTAKEDIIPLTHKHDIGYELTTQLLVDAEIGHPIAPTQMHWKTSDGEHSPAKTAPSAEEHRLEQIMSLMRDAAAKHLSAQTVHRIDREADSVFHYREWSAKGFQCLVRSDDDRLVQWRGELVHY
jgi:hypothetical protein